MGVLAWTIPLIKNKKIKKPVDIKKKTITALVINHLKM